jgi:hypothetical protein
MHMGLCHGGDLLAFGTNENRGVTLKILMSSL